MIGDRLFERIPADGLGFHELPGAIELGLRADKRRFGSLQNRRRAIGIRLQGSGVDLEQFLSRLDLGTLLEQSFFDDAADLRTDFRRPISSHPAGQFVDDGHRFRLNGDDRHQRRRNRLGLLLVRGGALIAAGDNQPHYQEDQSRVRTQKTGHAVSKRIWRVATRFTDFQGMP